MGKLVCIALIVTHVVGESRKYRFLLGIDLYDGIDRHEKWHRPFSMATTVPRNGIDRFKWQRPFTKGIFASAMAKNVFYLTPRRGFKHSDDGKSIHCFFYNNNDTFLQQFSLSFMLHTLIRMYRSSNCIEHLASSGFYRLLENFAI